MSRITIYHPSKYLGGTEILFSRIIELLLTQGYRDINVIDFNDGILSTELKNVHVNYHDIANFVRKDLIEDVTLIASARNIARVILECKLFNINKFKPMFWLLHPSELYSGYCLGSTPLKRRGYKYLSLYIKILPAIKVYKNIIQCLDSNQNLRIMDDACRRESEWAFNYSFDNDVVLPVITNLDYQFITQDLSDDKKILVLSRLDDFKTHGIVKLLDDIIKYNCSVSHGKIAVSIAGDGPARSILEDKYKNNNNVNVAFLGYVKNTDLTHFLESENCSILFAMGTSALEGGARGIPTVLLPSTDKSIANRDDLYKYLNDSNGFTLGEYINTPFESNGYLTFDEVIQIFERDKNNLASQTIAYFKRCYGKENTQDNLLRTISNLKYLQVNKLKLSKVFAIYTKFISCKRLRSGL